MCVLQLLNNVQHPLKLRGQSTCVRRAYLDHLANAISSTEMWHNSSDDWKMRLWNISSLRKRQLTVHLKRN